MKSSKLFSIITAFALIVVLNIDLLAFQSNIPTPESVIGFKPGTSYKLANWDQISSYFIKLGEASDRVEVHEMGKTEMGNPMLLALISSPENLRNKERIKEIQSKLADPRTMTSSDNIDALVSEGKSVVLFSMSLHANEVGASQMSPKLAYEFATKNDEITREILDNVVIVMFPGSNPDGVMLMADHYMSYINKGEDSAPSLPRVYNKYVGHDNNRDWYMLTQNESKIIAKEMYDVWHPEIVVDMHQMGNSGARFFLPPFADPLNPLINPLIVRELQMIGGYFSSDLIAGGYPWVENGRTFSMWWHGGMRTAPYFHNMVGILSEAASANLGSPIPAGSIREYKTPLPTLNYPAPWENNREWTLGDIVEQDRIAAIAVLKSAARNKDMFLRNYYEMNKKSIEGVYPDQPFAYIMPEDQHDKAAMVYFLEIMMRQDTDFEMAANDFMADGKNYKAGSVIAFLAQPARAHVEGIFGTQLYSEKYSRPYDIVGWTLPMQMGVQYDKIKNSFSVNTYKILKSKPILTGNIDQKSKAIYIGANSTNKYKAVNTLIKKKYKAKIVTEDYIVEGKTITAGSVVFKKSGKIIEDLIELTKEYSLDVVSVNKSDKSKSKNLKAPRVAMIDNPNSMPTGWMRWLLERHGFDYELIYQGDFDAGDLNKRFDVILATNPAMVKGVPSERRRGPVRYKSTPELKSFVENGGTVVAWSNVADYTIQSLGMNVKNAVTRDMGNVFNIPGSVIRLTVDTNHPVTYGMQDETFVFFRRNNVWNAGQGKVLATYPSSNVLVSGFIKGEEVIANTPGIIYDEIGKGKVVLINFEPTFRAQPVGTFKVVFNAIYNSVVKK